jgi:hypothetical protein
MAIVLINAFVFDFFSSSSFLLTDNLRIRSVGKDVFLRDNTATLAGLTSTNISSYQIFC